MPCDTFVALSTTTQDGSVIFGKNSDRPKSEAQEVVYVSRKTFDANQKLKCTYIEIDQEAITHAVILSKPCWMWGAEMGANEHGVVIGNEAVWTKALDDKNTEKRFLGMDLLRLGLERGETAEAALNVITSLLEKFGQGGPCFECSSRAGMEYHNSFIIADASEAWVLETVGKHWAAEKCTDGVRNISNQLSIGTNITRMSKGLKEYAQEQGWWDGAREFSFKHVFEDDADADNFVPSDRYVNGCNLLKAASGKFDLTSMMDILRNEESGICMTGNGRLSSVSTGSQVSVLSNAENKVLNHHWFTATPNPACSIFKPFIFVPDVVIGQLTVSEKGDNATPIGKAHARIKPLPGFDVNTKVLDQLREMEKDLIKDVEKISHKYDDAKSSELKTLFKDAVDSEMKFYKS